jgi:hypothetical protein
MKIAVAVVWLTLVAGAAPVFGQGRELVLGPEFEQRFEELGTWLREYEAWERWYELWGNRLVRNFNNNQVIWERKKRPEPPVWLEAECQDFLGEDGLLANACNLLRDWDNQPLRILQRRDSSLATSVGQIDDKVVKTSFFQRVHLTGLWAQAQYPAPPTYGIIGMQLGVFEAGRLTLPAVGVMLVLTPDGDGGHALQPATTLGFGFRLLDFVPPLMKKQVSLHINIARTSLHGGQDARSLPSTPNLNLFGLSVSARRHR